MHNEINARFAPGTSLAVRHGMGQGIIWTSIKNGLHRRCPQCGVGPLFSGWMTLRDRCPRCGLVYEPGAGDTWAFWIVADRIPIAIAIVAVYFGLGPRSWTQGALVIGAVAMVLIATIPQRIGLVTALDYLSRRWWPDEERAA